jgi:hypothetical protein
LIAKPDLKRVSPTFRAQNMDHLSQSLSINLSIRVLLNDLAFSNAISNRWTGSSSFVIEYGLKGFRL